jgi:hypothetical protein
MLPRRPGGVVSYCAVARSDIYISADIESDGPIPGRYSMLSFGLAVAATFDGRAFAPRDPAEATFGRELRPIAAEFMPAAVAVSGLDRDRLAREAADPAEAMAEADGWVRAQAGDARPVMVGYPIVFDWMFLHWYFVRFYGASPFGFSGALDMKTMYQRRGRDARPGRPRGPAAGARPRPAAHARHARRRHRAGRDLRPALVTARG